mgnify:CR=1 FL=1
MVNADNRVNKCWFLLIKLFLDDIPKNSLRTILIMMSPLLLLAVVFITLEALLQGLNTRATITLDLISISTGTLTWASTYLAIAIGLTLTYKVQRYGNFAQSEFFMIGMYLAMILVWSDYFVPEETHSAVDVNHFDFVEIGTSNYQTLTQARWFHGQGQ